MYVLLMFVYDDLYSCMIHRWVNSCQYRFTYSVYKFCNQMSAEWGSLPLLSLRCVLDHLSTEDALAALSTCRHWRSAILLYEGRK